MFPDYGADPVWADRGMVDLDALPVPEWLRADLRRWAREWEELMGVRESRYAVVDEPAHAVWEERGRRLADRLRAELGDAYDVVYERWPVD